MTVRNFRLLNRSEARALTSGVDAAFARWQQAWCAAEVRRAELSAAADASLVSACRWRSGAYPGGDAVAVGWTAPSAHTLVSLLVGDGIRAANGEAPPVAVDLERSALDALIASLLQEFAPTARRSANIEWDTQPPAAHAFDGGKNGFAVRLRVEKIDVLIVLSETVVEGFLSAQPRVKDRARRLASARGLLAGQPVTVEVQVGAAELTLAELASLGVGDVIALDHPLDHPLRVQAANGRVLCGGHLGIWNGKKAVQLAATNPNEEA
jgi:flagellar motor switch/type III secretory pathway protein FliN